jgi:hypothetical protein
MLYDIIMLLLYVLYCTGMDRVVIIFILYVIVNIGISTGVVVHFEKRKKKCFFCVLDLLVNTIKPVS